MKDYGQYIIANGHLSEEEVREYVSIQDALKYAFNDTKEKAFPLFTGEYEVTSQHRTFPTLKRIDGEPVEEEVRDNWDASDEDFVLPEGHFFEQREVTAIGWSIKVPNEFCILEENHG